MGGAYRGSDRQNSRTRILDQPGKPLCRESGLGAYIYRERIPVHGDVEKVARFSGADAVAWALHSGEEFELLFTLPRDRAEKVCNEIRLETGTEVTVIGEMRPKSDGILLIDSFKKEQQPLKSDGFRHF